MNNPMSEMPFKTGSRMACSISKWYGPESGNLRLSFKGTTMSRMLPLLLPNHLPSGVARVHSIVSWVMFPLGIRV